VIRQRPGQSDLHLAALMPSTVRHLDGPTMSLYDLSREHEPNATPLGLGGVEGDEGVARS
jgi:hypothetical protein